MRARADWRGHVVLASTRRICTRTFSRAGVSVTYNVGDVLEGYTTLNKLADSPEHVVRGTIRRCSITTRPLGLGRDAGRPADVDPKK